MSPLPAGPPVGLAASDPARAQGLEPTAVYARVSSLAQGEDEKTSLRTQVAECEQWAPRHGMAVDPTFVAQEAHTASTGTQQRPELMALVDRMVQHGVRHLVMDRTNRVTREGQLAASQLLYYLIEHGITLHLALENLTLDNAQSVAMFLMFAFLAQQDNDQRATTVQRNRREYAHSQHRYSRGARPPYGWQHEPVAVDSRGRPLTTRFVHDPATFPTLQRMLHAALRGESYGAIARHLSREGVPIPDLAATLKKRAKQGLPTDATWAREWAPSTVQRLVENPVNAGLVTSFRTKREWAPPDAAHPVRWRRTVRLPIEAHIALPSDLVVDPPLTVEQHRWLLRGDAVRKAQGARFRQRAVADDDAADRLAPALFRGGLLHHGDGCDGTLRVRQARGHAYYACTRHDRTPTACPGFSVPAATLDTLVWEAVRRVLLVPGRLERIAEAQRQADLAALNGGDGPGSLRYQEQVRADLLSECQHLAEQMAKTESQFVRDQLETLLTHKEPLLRDADARLAEQRAYQADEERRQAVVANVRQQLGQYAFAIGLLHLAPKAAWVGVVRHILRALGFAASVALAPGSRTGRGVKNGRRLVVDVTLNLAAGQPTVPWFDAQRSAEVMGKMDEMEQFMHERLAERLPTLRAEAGIAATEEGDEGADGEGDDDDLVYETSAGTVHVVTTVHTLRRAPSAHGAAARYRR